MRKSRNPEENIMIRKSMLALTAIAALGAAALAPTSASAFGFKGGGWGHHGWGHGYGFYGAGYGVSYVDVVPSCYYVKRVNRFGQLRLIKVCE
jgi:hypothetical protein